MAGSLLPQPKQTFTDDTGKPLSGGQIYTYAAGSLTPKATYQDAALTIANTNPVIANARGEIVMYGSGAYRVILKDKQGSTIWDRDNIESSASAISGAVGTLGDTLAAGGGSALVGFRPSDTGLMRTVQDKLRDVVGVKDDGAKGDGITADNPALAAIFAAHQNDKIALPAGDYLIDNSAGPFIVSGFNGQLVFEGKARLLFSDNTKAGIQFSGGTGARIVGICVAYKVTPPVRVGAQEAITIVSTTDTRIDSPYVENSPAAGLLFRECIRPRVSSATIVSSKADGVHFANCQDAQINGLSTADTGDDGLAFVNYANAAAYTGGLATNIRIRNSKARGIAVVGQSDVVIDGFEIDGTAASGIYTAYESAYSTRVPDNVLWANGIVKNAGTVTPFVGNQFGIDYNAVTSARYANIKVIGSGNRGMSGSAASGTIELSNVTVDTPLASNGFWLSAGKLIIDGITSINTPSYGSFINNCGSVIATNIRAVNAAITDGLARAVWFESNVRIIADGIHVIDDQNTATGYKIGTFGASQNGIINNMHFTLKNGTVVVEDGSFPNVVLGVSYENETKVGMRLFGAFIGFGAAAPTAGFYKRGDRIFNNAPAGGQPKSWVCTVAGTPGTFVSEGNL